MRKADRRCINVAQRFHWFKELTDSSGFPSLARGEHYELRLEWPQPLSHDPPIAEEIARQLEALVVAVTHNKDALRAAVLVKRARELPLQFTRGRRLHELHGFARKNRAQEGVCQQGIVCRSKVKTVRNKVGGVALNDEQVLAWQRIASGFRGAFLLS